MDWLVKNLESAFTSTAAVTVLAALISTVVAALTSVTKISASGIEISFGQVTKEQVAEVVREIESKTEKSDVSQTLLR